MRTGLYPGTFDPVTLGHVDILKRACSLVDHLVVGVAINADKEPLFSLEERVEMVTSVADKIALASETRISVHPFGNLLVQCAQDVSASIIIRGLRAVSDFEYEFQMVGMNRLLDESIETVFLMADAEYQAIASRLVKEIARLGGDVSRFVDSEIADALYRRLRSNGN
ncbi:MAG: pantetheine-phosphate adenylyltransferase [Rhodobacteraceae bacterium]|nr:pantetheine-phosphate adenylyltransferase [Paracoccaceae bacterium]